MNPTTKKTLFAIGFPFSPFYSQLMVLRAYLYRNRILKVHHLPVPVISVGNLTMGGTGKTPLVIYLASYLKANGFNPAVISRGYRGTSKARVNIVSDGTEICMNAMRSGDEPWLMANRLSGVVVATGKNRLLPSKEVLRAFGCDIIILDDGFQHLKLSRDIDLALFDVDEFAGNSRVFPGGDLREPVTALQRCSAFVLTGVNESNLSRAERCSALLSEKFKDKQIFQFRGSYSMALHHEFSDDSYVQNEFEIRELPAPLLCFCGIANPQRFQQALNEKNISITHFKAFQDHQTYTPEIIWKLIAEAKSRDALGLLTTEKDIAKIQAVYDHDFPLYSLPFEFEQNPEFEGYIKQLLAK